MLLPWSGRKRPLTGKRVVKISLGTGDEKTARQRWGAVHPQVDALVQIAELRARGRPEPEQPADVPRLDRSQVQRLADQAYQDVLATDDRTQVEPGFNSPIASILLDLNRRRAGKQADDGVVSERVSRAVEQRVLDGRLRRRKTHLMDAPIELTGLDSDAAHDLLAAVRAGDRLAPEQIEELANGIRIGEITSEVEQRLQENGLDLAADHIDRRQLALAITRGKLRALNDVGKRDRGAPIATPERPPVVHFEETPPRTTAPTLSALQERWIRLVRPKPKRVGDSERYLRLFVSLHGDLPVDKITGVHVRAFRDTLLECPRNAPKRLAEAGLLGLVAWSKVNPKKPKLGRETINHKGLGSLSTLLDQALKDEHIRSNPAKNQQLPIKPSDKQERRPYTLDELDRLLGTGIYQSHPRIPKAGWD